MFKFPLHSMMISAFIATTIWGTPAISGSNNVRDHRATQTVRDHLIKTTVRDHRTPRKSEVVVVGQGDKDCSYGMAYLYKMGYSDIRAYDCQGAVFHYGAIDGVVILRAAMSSHTGKMTIKMVGILSQ